MRGGIRVKGVSVCEIAYTTMSSRLTLSFVKDQITPQDHMYSGLFIALTPCTDKGSWITAQDSGVKRLWPSPSP